jgi:hypothetical protein
MRRHLLVVCTDTRIDPTVLTDAIREALARHPAGVTVVRVLIPAVLPPTLPISAWPPGMAERLGRLQEAAEAAIASGRAPGRVEIAACRGVSDLLAAAWPVDALVLVGRAGWSVRRAARGLAPDIVVVPSRKPRRSEPLPASRPKAIPQ